jgi:hypothetical protein
MKEDGRLFLVHTPFLNGIDTRIPSGHSNRQFHSFQKQHTKNYITCARAQVLRTTTGQIDPNNLILLVLHSLKR